jgi:MFS family permease
MTTDAAASSAARRGYTLAMLTALSAMNQLDRQLLNILVEPIRREFSLSDVQIGLLVGLSFAAVYSLLSIPAALYAARAGRRNLIAAAAVVWGIMTLGCGFAQFYWQLFIARFGVGIGEAGGMPPAHAMISDLYRPDERGSAMSTWAAGINGGVFIAFLSGGVIGHLYGWRTSFVVAGALTVLIAGLLRLTVREPERTDTTARHAPPTSLLLLRQTLRTVVADKTMRHVFLGATLESIVSYAALAWLASFLIRSHEMSLASTGIYLALVIGAGGALGTWAFGIASDRAQQGVNRSSLWLTASALIAAKPFTLGFLLVPSTPLALALFVIPGATGGIFVGPSLAVLHNRVASDMRPIVSALFLLFVNFIGLGVGPLLVGLLSEYVFSPSGADALRCSLIAIQLVAIWGALHYFIAAMNTERRT